MPTRPSQASLEILRAGLRRLALLLVGLAAVTAVGSLLLGVIAGFSAGRSISLGFYFVGSFCVLIGFVFGNRGPVRSKPSADPTRLPMPGVRLVRWATTDERTQTIADSALFVVIGIVLIFIGLAADTRTGVW